MTELPRKAVARTARLATLPLGFAGRATIGVGKRLRGTPTSVVAAEVQQRTAEQLFSVLGELKGGAMKVGQALSVFESALPEQLAAPYRATLTRLQDAAPPMSSTVVHETLAAELGADWRRRFSGFDDDPVAAASIGQVHRARWNDGREVAVKIQYPGAGDALRSDLRQIGRLAKVVGAFVPGLEIGPLAAELQSRVAEELDYGLEAEAQRMFATAFRGDPLIAVPDVVAQSGTVLVTEWLESDRSLARLIADGSQDERDGYGERYVRFLFSGPARAGMLHADPHPGNFRILADGRLGVVDYGAVARLPDGGLPLVIGTLMGRAVRGEWGAVLDGLRDAGFVRHGVDVDVGELRAYLSPFVEPAAQEMFTFSREWMRGQFSRVNDPRQESFSTMLKINLPPEFLLIHRVWLGGVGVLSQLGARAPFAAILADSLPGYSDTLGEP